MGDAPRGRARRVASSAAGFVVARSRTEKVGALVAIALLVSAPFGGLHRQPSPPPAHVAFGKAIDVGPFAFTYLKAVTVGDLGSAASPSIPGGRLFVIEARIANPGNRPEPATLLTSVFSVAGAGVPDVSGAPATPQMIDVKDGTSIGWINPGSSYTIALVWDQAPGWRGSRASVRIGGLVYRATDPLTLDPDSWWQTGVEAARATVTVQVRP